MSLFTAPVKYTKKVNGVDSRVIRSMLHEMWNRGNESYNLPTEPEGIHERHCHINELLVKHGLATVKDAPNE